MYSTDSIHVEVIQYSDAVGELLFNRGEHYYGFGYTIVSTGAKIPPWAIQPIDHLG